MEKFIMDLGNVIYNKKTSTEEQGSVIITINSEVPVLYNEQDGRLKIGKVINTTAQSVRVLIDKINREDGNDRTLGCITESGYTYIKIANILGIVDGINGFSV